jgi:hypothetical protein
MVSTLSRLDIHMLDLTVEYFKRYLVPDATCVEPLIDLAWSCEGAPNTGDVKRALRILGWQVRYLVHPTRPSDTYLIGVQGVRSLNCPYSIAYRRNNRRWLREAIEETLGIGGWRNEQ